MNIKNVIGALVVGCGALVSANAFADNEYHPNIRHSEPFKVGMQVDASVPAGGALGVNVKLPSLHWLTLGVAGTYALAPGLRGELTVEPKWVFAPTFSLDLGHAFPGSVPGVANSPSVEYTYFTMQPGLSVGNPDGFRFFLRGGLMHLDANVSSSGSAFSSLPKGTSIGGSPSASAWLAPSAQLGASWVF